MEIALRFFVTSNPDLEWDEALPHIQSTLNNSRNTSTNVEPNMIVQGFKSNLDALNPLVELPIEDYVAMRQVAWDQAADALAWAVAAMKDRYDSKHKPVRFKPGQKVLLKLYKGYRLPGYTSRKLSN